jgi:hypothetical protein
MHARGLILDAGILQNAAKEHAPHTPIAVWLKNQHQKGVRLVTIREVLRECINVPVALVESLHIVVEPSGNPPDPHGLLQAFSSGTRRVSFNESLPRADRAVVAHAIACHYDIVSTDWRMRQRSYRELLTRLDRMPDSRLPNWRLPNFHLEDRGTIHSMP